MGPPFQPSGPPICHQAVCDRHHSPANTRFWGHSFVSPDPGVSSEDSKLLHSPFNKYQFQFSFKKKKETGSPCPMVAFPATFWAQVGASSPSRKQLCILPHLTRGQGRSSLLVQRPCWPVTWALWVWALSISSL